jgi:hypothetical protein
MPQWGKKESRELNDEIVIPSDAVISLREINKETLGEILALEVNENQRQFVATNAKSIAQAHFAGDVAWFRAIYEIGRASGRERVSEGV